MTNGPPWLVLVNPAAGRRPVAPAAVAAILRQAGVEHMLEAPAGPDEMRLAIGGYAFAGGRRLAVVGGDGTVNLAANVLMGLPREARPLVGVLPGGTGCDLLRTFGIPQRLEEAVKRLHGDQTYQVDVGRLEGDFGVRYFVNVAQAGVGAAAAESALRLGRFLGKARYPLAFLGRLPGFPGSAVKLLMPDRNHDSPALAVIFANGQFFAGGWNVAPRATMIDGRLDLQIINCSKWAAPRLVPKIIKGVHLTERAVRRFSVNGFTLETGGRWPVEADGDYVGNTPVVVGVEPGAIDLKI
jgi:diacylglycerol kinase (ATP)